MNVSAIKTLADVLEAIKTWGENAFLVGASTIGEIPTGHRVVINLVQINPDEPSMVYPTGSSKKVGNDWIELLSLGNTPLRRIAQAAGLSWIPEMSGRIDDGSNPRRIAFIKACSCRDLMGETRTQTGTYELDFDKREADLVQSKLKAYEKAAEKTYRKNPKGPTEGEIFRAANPDKQKWAEEAARQDVIRMMVHGLQRAETGAENRAIIAALGLRRAGYTADELRKKPFAVFRLVDDIDWAHDPQAHAAQILQASGLARMIAFGGQVNTLREMLVLPVTTTHPAIAASVAQLVPVTVSASAEAVEDPDIPDVAAEIDAQAEPVSPQSVPTAAAEQPTAKIQQFGEAFELPTIEAFKTMTRAERESWVKHLLLTRETKPVSKDPKDLTDAELVSWFTGMLALPPKGEVAK